MTTLADVLNYALEDIRRMREGFPEEDYQRLLELHRNRKKLCEDCSPEQLIYAMDVLTKQAVMIFYMTGVARGAMGQVDLDKLCLKGPRKPLLQIVPKEVEDG